MWGFLLLQWSENRGLVSLTQHHLTLRVLRLRRWKMIFLRNRIEFSPRYELLIEFYFPFLEAQSAPYCVVSLVVWCRNGTKLSPEKHECERYLPIPDVVQEKSFRGTPWPCFLLSIGASTETSEGKVVLPTGETLTHRIKCRHLQSRKPTVDYYVRG